MGIIKNFNQFNKVHESDNVTEPRVKEPRVKEPTTPETDVPEPRIKRGDKKFITKPSIKDVNIKTGDYRVTENKSNQAIKDIVFFNKIAIFEKSVMAKDAYNILESLKVDKNKLWYFMMDRNDNSIQIVKYNYEQGFHLLNLVSELFKKYDTVPQLKESLTSQNIKFSGGKEFVVISNLNENLKNLIKIDITKLLSK